MKKAYRKATLCVHPDKLQQRGATVQQKYICEKVFDLLKVCLCYASYLFELYATLVLWLLLKYALEQVIKHQEFGLSTQ